MKIAVMGTGGVGGVFGARLAQAGCDVHFIARGAHLAAIKQNGLSLVSDEVGSALLKPAQATDDPSSIGPVDVVFVSVKLWDTEDAALKIKPLVSEETAIISLQNGISKDEIFRSHYGADHTVGGVSYVAATISEPGVVTQKGTVQRLVFGEYGKPSSKRLEALQQACLKAGLEAEIHTDIEKAIWEKFVFLVAMSAVTAATRQTIGPVRSHPSTRQLLIDVMTEAIAVAKARGITFDDSLVERRLEYWDNLSPDVTSSMQHDLEQGNRLELPWLSGKVVELGKSLAVETPVNRVLVDVLSPFIDGSASNGRK
ncbi:MAG: 2-dehydropantoate 2-reductase [Candidatus Melainabacteria bacterium]|nr:2-dehydropantoate 2-reductase [Candidatus Melainabacteria bacterium]